MKETLVKILKLENLAEIVRLTRQLNPDIDITELEKRQSEMFGLDTYTCFGLFEKGILIGVSSGWITVRLYSGKQLEVDNVIIDSTIQSKGYGKLFMDEIESWAKTNHCKTVELNTYVQNGRSHKFYFKQGFEILGFHFQKLL
jgi:GNAT superfamily N-acetyltransferase